MWSIHTAEYSSACKRKASLTPVAAEMSPEDPLK